MQAATQDPWSPAVLDLFLPIVSIYRAECLKIEAVLAGAIRCCRPGSSPLETASNGVVRNSRVVKLHLIALTLAPFLLYGAVVAGESNVHVLAQKVDEHYNRLRTMRAEFTESYRGMGLDRTETGTLWLKKPGKMRWEYRSPREKLFISDGKNAWFYLPGDKQVRKTEVRKLDDLRSPLAFLLGKTHLEKELRGLSLAPDQVPLRPGDVVVRGVPKSLEDRVSQILLEVTPEGQIFRIQVDEVDGGITEYRFTEEKENVEVSDRLFHFALPAGVEVVDGEFGQ